MEIKLQNKLKTKQQMADLLLSFNHFVSVSFQIKPKQRAGKTHCSCEG
jgi:hypothetical protein